MDEIARFLVRPHTYDDHPYSEAQIKTLKYQPELLSLQLLEVYQSI